MGDRVFLKVVLLSLALAVVASGVSAWFKPKPILVGVLHSQSGTMAFSEKGVLQATLAAIDDVNAHGGVLGRPLKAVVADGESDARVFAQRATHLLTFDQVPVVFGGWTSASRKAILPALEKHNGLLFYPVQYEGIEQSSHVIYTGMAPNQQIYPALTYMTQTFGKKVVLVGSDYIYPRIANEIARLVLTALGASVCAESYMPLGVQDASAVMDQVVRCQPDYILNTVNGDSNYALLKALRAFDDKIPVMSLSLGESEMRQLIPLLGTTATNAHYVSWGYLQSLKTPENEDFVRTLQAKMPDSAISHPMKVAWDGVHLWANAANLSGTVDSDVLSKNLAGMSYPSATGVVAIDAENRHLWQPVFIGKAQSDGNFAVLWQSQGVVAPQPWPIGHSRGAWEKREQAWYLSWGDQWQAP